MAKHTSYSAEIDACNVVSYEVSILGNRLITESNAIAEINPKSTVDFILVFERKFAGIIYFVDL